MEINSNKIIIIKTKVGFMIKKQQNAIQNYFSYFQPKHSKESSQWEGFFEHPKQM